MLKKIFYTMLILFGFGSIAEMNHMGMSEGFNGSFELRYKLTLRIVVVSLL